MTIEPIAYRSPHTATELPPAFKTLLARLVIVCWLLPLAVGLLTFAATEWIHRNDPGHHIGVFPFGLQDTPVDDLLVVIGAWTIQIGALLAAVGFVLVTVFFARRINPAQDRWRQVVKPSLLMLFLLAANFPIAFGIVVLVTR